jgi:hypothetical protein
MMLTLSPLRSAPGCRERRRSTGPESLVTPAQSAGGIQDHVSALQRLVGNRAVNQILWRALPDDLTSEMMTAVAGAPLPTSSAGGSGGPGCGDLGQRIRDFIDGGNGIKRGLKERYQDLLDDVHDLYLNHRTVANPDPVYGSWDGHVQQYENQRRGLQNRVDKYKDDNCDDPNTPGGGQPLAADVMTWYAQSAPAQPTGNANPREADGPDGDQPGILSRPDNGGVVSLPAGGWGVRVDCVPSVWGSSGGLGNPVAAVGAAGAMDDSPCPPAYEPKYTVVPAQQGATSGDQAQPVTGDQPGPVPINPDPIPTPGPFGGGKWVPDIPEIPPIFGPGGLIPLGAAVTAPGDAASPAASDETPAPAPIAGQVVDTGAAVGSASAEPGSISGVTGGAAADDVVGSANAPTGGGPTADEVQTSASASTPAAADAQNDNEE